MPIANNILIADFSSGRKDTITAALNQYDYGQVIQFNGLELPDTFTVRFSNYKAGNTSKSQIGENGQVEIPDEFLRTGKPVFAWVFLRAGEDDGETVRKVEIPVIPQPEPTDEEPTPQQQSVIDNLVAALQAGVEAAAQSAEDAQEIVESIEMDQYSDDGDGNITITRTFGGGE